MIFFKFLIISFTIISTINSLYASSMTIYRQVKTGDIILLPLNCYICTMIEKEEDSNFSHVGIIYKDVAHKKLYVWESWEKVTKTPFDIFIARREVGDKIIIRRHLDYPLIDEKLAKEYFKFNFKGRLYDHSFRWYNLDQNGFEKYYCSEFVVKFLNQFVLKKILTKKMHFDYQRDIWERYFHGDVPDGEDGLSPGDLERSTLFFNVLDIL